MKRYIALFSILVVFASLLVGCDLNRMGKDEYYVQITTDGIEKNEKADNVIAWLECRLFACTKAPFWIKEPARCWAFSL